MDEGMLLVVLLDLMAWLKAHGKYYGGWEGAKPEDLINSL